MTKALISLAPFEHEWPAPAQHPWTRPRAGFIAHLVATKAQAPQTRARRRVEPVEAVAVYGAVGHWPTPSGRTLSRSL